MAARASQQLLQKALRASVSVAARRGLCSAVTGEERISRILNETFKPTVLDIDDISGGCGSMYAITIESEAFRGKRQVEQHKMVNKALAEEIKSLHGLRIATSVPES